MAFTRNYRNIVLSNFHVVTESTSKVFASTNTRALKTEDGTIFDAEWKNSTLFSEYGDQPDDYIRVSPMVKNYLRFGTNASDESIEDYSISEPSTLVYQSKQTRITKDDSGNIIVTFEYTIYNPSNITITEFGIFDRFRYKRDASYYYLIYRKKLDEPINLLADAPVTISFDVVFPSVI